MTRPEEALALARERALQARERGGYARDVAADGVESTRPGTLERLLELAMVEPDLGEVRSTRRLGAPITFGKRMLVRTLDQYNRQLIARQQLFNIQVAIALADLAARVERLEDQRG